MRFLKWQTAYFCFKPSLQCTFVRKFDKSKILVSTKSAEYNSVNNFMGAFAKFKKPSRFDLMCILIEVAIFSHSVNRTQQILSFQ